MFQCRRLYWDYPNASDIKRIRKFGWQKQFKNATGRRAIMNRIVKGERYLAEF